VTIDPLADIDPATVDRVSNALGLHFVHVSQTVLPAFVDDPTITERELALGICQALVDGLGSVLPLFSPSLRSFLIVGIAKKLDTSTRERT
jgi:hypothetical protein